jgi:hypothetical protein
VSAARHCATHSRTAGASHPRRRMVESLKRDGRPSCAHVGPCRDVGRVPFVTISHVRPSLPPRPGHCNTILNVVEARGDRTSPRPLLCSVRPLVNGPLESTRGRRPNGRLIRHHPRSRSWTDTGHAMTSRQKQGSPGRPSTPRHCTSCLHT